MLQGRLFTPPQATLAFISSGMCLGFQGVGLPPAPVLPGEGTLQSGDHFGFLCWETGVIWGGIDKQDETRDDSQFSLGNVAS